MSEFRSDAEKFVTAFLDYMHKYDILDELNKRTQKMERSPGVEALYKQAQAVFPERKPATAGKEMTELSEEKRDEAIVAAPNVADTREMFSRRIQANGGVRELLRRIVEDKDEYAEVEAMDFLAAERGEKEFDVPTKA